MGLDIYFMRIRKEDEEEVAYFRKVNFLLPYFDYGWNNSADKPISFQQIKNLVTTCNKVLKTKNTSLLPTQDGCFFGSTDYDDEYFMYIKYVRDTFKSIIKDHQKGDTYTMYCSW